tara:strand:+ start:3533 stop:4258 length:726 start_codon:yes stop_codon:yes gene_type:complete
MTVTVRLTDICLDVSANQQHQTLKGLFLRRTRNPRQINRILDVPLFEAKKGDKICVVGRNGQGKTTLLKVISKIYRPTAGTVWTSFKPTAVLAAGIGLEDDFTVQENIEFTLLLNNISAKRMAKISQSILEFCDLQQDRKKQYKHLSSGYKSRLAFAIAISNEPKILVLDEVLGGGDEFFMKKASRKLKDSIIQSETAFIATHGPDDFRDICNRIIVVDQSKIVFDGKFDQGLSFYRNLFD